MKRFYITTPLYYVNDVPHIGHAYTTIAADILARWKRLTGVPVFFLTGTDEHGSKIAQAAVAHNKSPQEYADGVAERFVKLWAKLNISYDDFIRTTEQRHVKVVQWAFDQLINRGQITQGVYENWYCTPCETYYTESELNNNNCPVCGRPVEWLSEETYFFKLSLYSAKLLELYQKSTGFLQPGFRSSEITNFVNDGLKDLSVSRSRVQWGIPVKQAPHHTVYVWFDALLNYYTAAGNSDNVWPADVHIVGKEIFRFHTVIWPAMLMALDLPLPKSVFAHGWWTVEGQKMSKSLGNVVDPWNIVDEFGVDVLRYFLFRQIPFGGDGDFSMAALRSANNAYLANDLGNLFNRILALALKLKEAGGLLRSDGFLQKSFPAVAGEMNKAVENLAFQDALLEVWKVVDAANAYINEKAPWKLVKENVALAGEVLGESLAALKFLTVVLSPFMPQTCDKMQEMLGVNETRGELLKELLPTGKWESSPRWPAITGPVQPLFPRK